MTRRVAGARGIGLGFGLVAGLVGVAQWALALHDVAEQLAAFRDARQLDPDFFDFTPLFQANERFSFLSALVAAAVMLTLCWLAAFTASRMSRRRQDGVVAGVVAVFVGGAMYAVATPFAVAMSPDPTMTREVMGCCVVPVGVAFFAFAILLVPAGAGLGAHARKSSSPRRLVE